MSQSELSLYPKISSIYNKILQLAIAIVFIVILMNIWIDGVSKSKANIASHFELFGQTYLSQAALGATVVMENKDRKMIKTFIEELGSPSFVREVMLYDETGQLIASTGKSSSINDLYGISIESINLSKRYVPFIQELRKDKLHGYLRVTIEESYMTSALSKANSNKQELTRIMLIMAGLVGFFLTRGLSRFSRQGYRIANQNR